MKSTNTNTTTKGLLTQLTLAGTAALAGFAANGQILATDVNENVGLAPGDFASVNLALPGATSINLFSIHKTNAFTSSGYNYVQHLRNIGVQGVGGAQILRIPKAHQRVYYYSGGRLTSIGNRGTGNNLGVLAVPAGKIWATAPKLTSTRHVTAIGGIDHVNFLRNTNAYAHIAGANGTFRSGIKTKAGSSHYMDQTTSQYIAFEFLNSLTGVEDFGWIKANLTGYSVSDLGLHVDSYAYDASGAQIAMGNRSAPVATPEPSSAMAFAALSALSLGAVGVRRLKAMRKAA